MLFCNKLMHYSDCNDMAIMLQNYLSVILIEINAVVLNLHVTLKTGVIILKIHWNKVNLNRKLLF